MAYQIPDEIAKRHGFTQLEGVYLGLTREFISKKANRLLAYWDEKRRDKDVPDWSQVAIIDLPELAPWLMVKDRVGEREWRNRFYGSALTEQLGLEATGLHVSEYHPADQVDDILKGYQMMVDGRAPLRCIGHFVQEDKEHIPYEGIYLPLSAGGTRIEKMLAVPDYAFAEN